MVSISLRKQRTLRHPFAAFPTRTSLALLPGDSGAFANDQAGLYGQGLYTLVIGVADFFEQDGDDDAAHVVGIAVDGGVGNGQVLAEIGIVKADQ